MNNDSFNPCLHILLIEDSEDDYHVTRHLLEEMDWSSLEAQSFELKWVDSYDEGRRELLSDSYDIALIDYRLGSSNGVELLLEVRSKGCYVPIVILTGQGERNIDIAAMRAGAAEYLQKNLLNITLLEHILRYALAHGRSEAALREAANRSRELALKSNLLAVAVSNLADGVVITDACQPDNPIIFANSAFCALTGYSEAETLGRNCRFLQGPETSRVEVARIRAAVQQKQPFSGVLLNYRKDGSVFWNGLKISPVFDDNGQLINFVGLQSDVTQRKLAEENVRFQARLLDTVGQAVIATDLHGTIAYMNGSAERLYGWPIHEAVGQNIAATVIPEISRQQAEEVLAKIKNGAVWSGDMMVQRRDGTMFPIAITNAPIFDDAGNVMGLIGVSEDITQRKLDEQALRESEARFQRIVANTPGMVYQYLQRPDGTHEFPFVSEGCRELLEWNPALARNNPELQVALFDPGDRPACEQSVAIAAATLQPWKWEGRIQVPSGKVKWVTASARPQRLPDGSILWDGLIMDVTERKLAEILLEDQSHALEMVARGMPLPATLDHLCLLMEKQMDGAMCSILLLDEEKRTLRHAAAPSLPPAYSEAIDGVEIGPHVGSCGTAAFLGEPVIVSEISSSPLWSDYAELAATHGFKACWSNPIYDVSHTIQGTFAVYFGDVREPQPNEWHFIEQACDIAAIAIERQRTEEALRGSNDDLEQRVAERTAQLEKAKEEAENASIQAEQLRREADLANSAKSEFLSRMSHELRTPLNAILGFGQILQMRNLGVKDSEGVDQILRGGRHLLNLINEVLDIARVEAGGLDLNIEPVGLAATVADICALVKPLADERGVILLENFDQLKPYHVMADVQKLKQVLLNLLSNAIKYNRPQGTVSISATVTAERALRVAVHDTGTGISPQDLPKLFTPFERLGAVNSTIEGTGLGLVLSMRLIEAMEGKLAVASVPGEGSVFSLELPVADAAAVVPPSQMAGANASKPAAGSHTILCIEDNLSNLSLIETIMEERPNVALLAAMQGSVGLDLARQHKTDLILLDLNLPDIDGKEVLVRLKQSVVTSAVPVIVISADATLLQRERLLKMGAHDYLTKPLDVALFLRTVDDILQNKPNA